MGHRMDSMLEMRNVGTYAVDPCQCPERSRLPCHADPFDWLMTGAGKHLIAAQGRSSNTLSLIENTLQRVWGCRPQIHLWFEATKRKLCESY